jgi:metal-responsive CopG/Arc/MetJ family transcriptional regulator
MYTTSQKGVEMDNASQKSRIQVTISPELLARLDAYCKRIGVSRSAYIQIVLGQNLDGLERMYANVSDGIVGVVSEAQQG